MSVLLSAAFFLTFPSATAARPPHDGEGRDLFDHLVAANEAQVVMLTEEGLMDNELAGQLLKRLHQLKEQSAPRSDDYLDLEAALVSKIGDRATNIHLGRSRNDLGAAMNRMLLRDRLLTVLVEQADVRETLQQLAATHRDTLAPGLTHAVQAQPTTLGHMLLAFDAHLGRDAARLEAAYGRLNLSPLGAAAITGSGFPLDRDRLAALLGFDGVVANTYDAIVLATGDSKIEVAQSAGLSALAVGRFAQDVLFQYDDPSPGLVLTEEDSRRSSIMPQKRNPGLVERLRVAATEVYAGSVEIALLAHNTPMHEVRDTRTPMTEHSDDLLVAAAAMYSRLDDCLRALTVQRDELAAKIDADYATMTELADTLYREGDVPFRQGYAFASALSGYGRSEGMKPLEISHDKAAEIYANVVGGPFPITPKAFRQALEPARQIETRQVSGGPQPSSMSMMLEAAANDLDARRSFVDKARRRIDQADREREKSTDRLLSD